MKYMRKYIIIIFILVYSYVKKISFIKLEKSSYLFVFYNDT